VLACDTRSRIRDGMRRYIVTFIDPVYYFAFALATSSRHACLTARALTLALSLLPRKPRTPLSDNGSCTNFLDTDLWLMRLFGWHWTLGLQGVT
jgi:hypothetical protein